MQPNKIKQKALWLGGLALLTHTALLAQPVGQWDFDSGSLAATVGQPLTFRDNDTQTQTAFGTTTSFGIPAINGTNASVMRFPAATNLMGYLMPTPAANGGGSTVNEYTILFDVLYPTAGGNRPLVDTDFGFAEIVAGPDLIINPGGGIGIPPNGPFDGTVAANTWYRIGFVVTPTEVRKYIDGVEVGLQAGTGIDNRLSLTANSTALILANTLSGATLGYVNSIQLRTTALNAGQMKALGAASAAGIPAVIPPVPSFLASRTPASGATGVNEEPTITAVLNQGDTVITGGSVQMFLDGAPVGTVTATPPTYTVSYTVPPRLDPLSTHQVTVRWTDNKVGANTNSWTFSVLNYQSVTLPQPFYFENFDSFSEDPTPGVALPAGWRVENQTCDGTAGFDLENRNSDSYKDWILISENRFLGWDANRTALPTIVLNGTKLTSLASGNLMWSESDSRSGSCNGQFADLYTGPISCANRTNVFVAFHSIYMQNQDNMNFMEYSVDGGVTWLPVFYYFDSDPANSDIVYTNGVADVPATFARVDANRNWNPIAVAATNYGSYIKAPISSIRPSHIFGILNDSNTEGKRIEVVRLAAADGKADVRFRLNANGTSAWFWGIDNFGLYEINTPVISGQPQSKRINATESTTFTVVASSSSPLTYRWQRNGINLTDGGRFSGVTTATLTVSNAGGEDSGSYRAVVSNSSGSVNSLAATLTVVDAPVIDIQPISMLVSTGYPALFTVTASGRPPMSYQWQKNGSPVGGNSSAFTIPSVTLADAGPYRVVITNISGAVTSSVVQLTVAGGAITNSLVAHLKFDGNYNDASGRGNNASPVGAPTFNPGGRIGQAFQFSTTGAGDRNYATLFYPDDLKFTSASDFTISFWSKIAPGSKSDDPALIANKNWASGGNIGYVLGVQGGNALEWNYREECPNTRKDFDSNVNLVDGQWHHIVFSVQRGQRAWTIVDGVLVDSRSMADGNNPPTTIDTDVEIADNQNCPGNGTRGANAINIGQDGTGNYGASITNALIDDVGFWRRALTPQEAQAIYTAGFTGKDLANAVVAPPVSAPLITVHPQSVTNNQNLDVRFTVTATGSDLTYQWKKGNVDIAGATSSALTLASIKASDAGDYRVAVQNNAGSTTSDAATLTVLPVPAPRLTGQWDFQNGLAATLGTGLQFFDAKVQNDTTFGTTTSYGIGDIAGSPANVMRFVHSSSPWGGYKAVHGATPNGGGVYVNQYTLIYDVYYPAASNGKWRSFFQTSTNNSNDGDFFVNTGNGIGISGNYQGVVTADAWHRIAFAVDVSSPASPAVAKWIDGVKVGYQTGLSGGKDGRFSLDPMALLFADEDGDQAETFVSSVQFWNGKLPDELIAAMGTPKASKLPGAITARAVTGGVEIYRTGGLGVEQADSPAGPWTEVIGAANPLVVPATGAPKYFRPKF